MKFKIVHSKEDAHGLFTAICHPSRMDEPRFCVYVHKDSEGIIRYIGEGTLERAKMFNRPREKLYSNFFTEGKNATLEIVKDGLTKSEAEELEFTLRELNLATIVNDPHATKRVKPIDIGLVSSVVKYDESSRTFLTWIGKPSPKSTLRIGEPAGYFHRSSGYHYISISSNRYAIHRIVWTLNNGDIQSGMVIDHIDNNKSNNSISNLRICTYNDNTRNSNKKLKSNSGFKFIHKTDRRYSVSWKEGGPTKRYFKRFAISRYETEKHALEAALAFRQQLVADGRISLKADGDEGGHFGN